MRNMSSQRRIVVVTALVVVGAMLLFPPWRFLLTVGSEGVGPVTVSRSAGYHPVFAPPEVDAESLQELFDVSYGLFEATVDVTRMLIQIAVVAVVAACAYIVLPYASDSRPSDG